MALKQQVLNVIKSGVPTFDEENDYFSVSFDIISGSLQLPFYFDTDSVMSDDTTFDITDYLHPDLLRSIIDTTDIDYSEPDSCVYGNLIYSSGNLEIQLETRCEDEESDDDDAEIWKIQTKTIE
jgi:hypothetical protein